MGTEGVSRFFDTYFPRRNQTQFGKFLGCMRQQIDSNTERFDLRLGLLDPARGTHLMQLEPQS